MSAEAAKIMAEVHVTNIPDVCLVLTSGDSEGLRIFANVALLRNASPVFHSLLGPHFLEGHHIANNPEPTAQEIELPDDDPQDMFLLLQVLHQRFRDIQQHVGLPNFQVGKMRAIAVLADKYDVCQALNIALHLIINPSSIYDLEDCQDMWSIITASYIVGNRNIFKTTSVALIMHCVDAYSTFIVGSEPPREFEMWICIMLEQKRARERARVASNLARGLSSMIDSLDPDEVDCNAGHLFYYVDSNEDDKTHHVEDFMPCMDYLDSLESVRDFLDGKRIEDDSGTLKSTMDELKQGADMGICFDCIENRGQHQDHCMED